MGNWGLFKVAVNRASDSDFNGDLLVDNQVIAIAIAMRLAKSGNDILLAMTLAFIKAFPATYTAKMMARSDAEFPMTRTNNINFSA